MSSFPNVFFAPEEHLCVWLNVLHEEIFLIISPRIVSNESCIEMQPLLLHCTVRLARFPCSLAVYLACYDQQHASRTHTHASHTHTPAELQHVVRRGGMQGWNWLANPPFLKKVGLNPQWP